MSGRKISKANAAHVKAIREAVTALEAQLPEAPKDEPTTDEPTVEPEAKASPTAPRHFTAMVCKALPPGFTPTQEGTLVVVASEAVVDRYGDIVRQNWDLANYLANPVVLFGHDWSDPPIGNALQVAVVDGRLLAEILFDEADLKAADIARKYREGFMSTVSVGFRSGIMSPRWKLAENDPEYAAEGCILDRNELIEISCVPVPALPSATAQRSAPLPLLDQVRAAIRSDAGFRNELEAELASSAPVVPPANPGPDAVPEAATLEAWLNKR